MKLTERQKKAILAAAFRWAAGERALRNHVNYAGMPAAGEDRHKIVLESDASEQALLEAVEITYPRNAKEQHERTTSGGGTCAVRSVSSAEAVHVGRRSQSSCRRKE